MPDTVDLVPQDMRQPRSVDVEPEDPNKPRIKKMSDYEVLKEIGDGSFSVVYAAKERSEPFRDVAIKMCFKKQIIKLKRVDAIYKEKDVLVRLSLPENRNPFIINLYATFTDTDHLYFVTSYAKYGDLLQLMSSRPLKHFDLQETVFYSSELLHALQHLHKLSIIHRDVKPENILIAETGHILLSDFGVVKDLTAPKKEVPPELEGRVRRSSFVGTAQYISPEILDGGKQSFASDLWSFGVVIYQLLSGTHCFHDISEYLIFKRIQKLLYKFPEDFTPETCDLIQNLFIIEPSQRLGAEENGGPEALRSHPFFNGVDWDNLEHVTPPKI